MCSLETQTDEDGAIVAQLIWRPLEKILIWAFIALVVLVLGTAATVGVLVYVQPGHTTKLKEHDAALQTIATTLERVTTKLDGMQKWQDSANVDDRYTTSNAEADRIINVTERGKVFDTLEALRDRYDEHLKEFADHRAEPAHTGSDARLTAIEARMALLENLLQQHD